MDRYTLTGTVDSLGEIQKISDKFSKQEMVVKIQQDYDNEIKIEWINSKCDIIRTIQVGDMVKVHWYLSGRPWKNKDGKVIHFTTLKGDDCELIQATNPEPIDITSEDEGDLPF